MDFRTELIMLVFRMQIMSMVIAYSDAVVVENIVYLYVADAVFEVLWLWSSLFLFHFHKMMFYECNNYFTLYWIGGWTLSSNTLVDNYGKKCLNLCLWSENEHFIVKEAGALKMPVFSQ